jgi:predicted  nucleic acid-binding Zn-ribbon protein
MSDLNQVIDIAKILITVGETAMSEIDKAKQAIAGATAQLKDTLAEAQKMRDQLAADRKGADDALDKKFDKGGPA